MLLMQSADSILPTMQSIKDGDDKVKVTEASAIFLQIHSFKFLMTLIIVWRILCTKGLSDHLQNTKLL